MKYIAAALTDIGTRKKVNQDSICIKIADTDKCGQVVMAIICDGMGGLSEGELASSTVINSFSIWFENELPNKLISFDFEKIAAEWEQQAYQLNYKIENYGINKGIKIGTTLSAILMVEGNYVCMHIGDSRIYKINEGVKQLTSDHTFVAREVAYGRLTKEEARIDSRRNILLQCIGASKNLKPEITYGKVEENDIIMLCSDGLYHTFTEINLKECIEVESINSIGDMHQIGRNMIDKAKKNNEKDNITIGMIKCYRNEVR